MPTFKTPSQEKLNDLHAIMFEIETIEKYRNIAH